MIVIDFVSAIPFRPYNNVLLYDGDNTSCNGGNITGRIFLSYTAQPLSVRLDVMRYEEPPSTGQVVVIILMAHLYFR